MAENDEQAMMMLRELMSFLPSNNMEDPPIKVCTDSIHREEDSLDKIVPDDRTSHTICMKSSPVWSMTSIFEIQPIMQNIIVVLLV